jgi:hypothetical protein
LLPFTISTYVTTFPAFTAFATLTTSTTVTTVTTFTALTIFTTLAYTTLAYSTLSISWLHTYLPSAITATPTTPTSFTTTAALHATGRPRTCAHASLTAIVFTLQGDVYTGIYPCSNPRQREVCAVFMYLKPGILIKSYLSMEYASLHGSYLSEIYRTSTKLESFKYIQWWAIYF